MSGRVSSSKPINASRLVHRITIQERTGVVTNANGFDEEQWVDLRTVWASMSNLDGREFWTAKAVQSETTVEFGIRYASFVDTLDSKNHRITHGKKTVEGIEEDRIYNITFIDQGEYKRVFVKIKTLELVV